MAACWVVVVAAGAVTAAGVAGAATFGATGACANEAAATLENNTVAIRFLIFDMV